MRILHVIGSLDPARGGPAAVALRLAAAQYGAGHRVAIASPPEPAATARIAAAAKRIPDGAGVERLIAPGTERGALRTLLKRRAWDALVAGADILHLHGVWEPMLSAAASAARRAGKPYCLEPHGMLDRWSLDAKKWKKRLALGLGMRRTITGASFLLALNDDEVRLMGGLGNRSAPPRIVVPNGVFLEEIEPLPPQGAFRRRHPRLFGRRYVLFLSRLHHKKGLDHLAEAFRRLAPLHPDLDLVVAGPDDGARAPFERAIAAAGLSRRVLLLDGLWGDEKIEAMVDAECFCLPSRQEGFSMAITEALACGTPVVISEECRFPEVAAEGAGEVLPLDPAAFADAIDALLRAPERALAMGRAGRRLVRAAFTWPAIALRTVQAYRLYVSETATGGAVVRLPRLAEPRKAGS